MTVTTVATAPIIAEVATMLLKMSYPVAPVLLMGSSRA